MQHGFSCPRVGANHNSVAVSLGMWALPSPVGPRWALWNKRDLHTFKTQIKQTATPPPEAFDPLEHASKRYASPTANVRELMQSISDSKPACQPTTYPTALPVGRRLSCHPAPPLTPPWRGPGSDSFGRCRGCSEIGRCGAVRTRQRSERPPGHGGGCGGTHPRSKWAQGIG